MQQTWGLGTFIIGIVMIYGGLTGWPSEVSRGATAPGVYEQQRLRSTEGPPAGYDNWTNQLQRQKERGRWQQQ
jgi:hypothetical protein